MKPFRPKLLTLAIANILGVSMAGAVTLNVDTVDDTVDNTDGVLSLREAILDSMSADVIDLSAIAGETITLSPGALSIDGKALHIVAPPAADGAPSVTISAGSPGQRLFDVTNSAVIFQGLTLTGGSSDAEGGAIRAEDSDLIIANSVISGNTAVGAGGGLAAKNANVCLTASSLTDNSVTASASDGTAIGGGAMVVGTLSALGNPKYDETPACFTDSPVLEGFPFPDFAAVAAAGRGVQVTGNRATADDSGSGFSSSTQPQTLAAQGGGLAIIPSSTATDFSCGGLSFLGSDESVACLLGATVRDNVAETLVGAAVDSPNPRLLTAQGGGVFLGRQVDGGVSLLVYASDISDNLATVTDNEEGKYSGTDNSTAIDVRGGGIGAGRVDEGMAILDSIGAGPSDDIELSLFSSIISGNTVEAAPPSQVGDATGVVYGSGGGIAGYAGDSTGSEFAIISLLSVVSGNSVVTGDSLGSANAYLSGGGISGVPTFDDLGNPSAPGIYLSKYSANENNSIIAAPHAETTAFGGGVAMAGTTILAGTKAVFDDFDDEGAPYSPIFTAIAAAKGSVSGNSIRAAGASNGMRLFGGGLSNLPVAGDLGGSLGPFGGNAGTGIKYAAITGNAVTVTGAADASDIEAGGAGIMSFTEYNRGGASTISDNAISISGSGFAGSASGGGLLLANKYAESAHYQSTLARNSITVSGTDDFSMAGGGIACGTFAELISDFAELISDVRDCAFTNTTIAENTLSSVAGGGAGVSAVGAGAAARSDTLLFEHVTVANNTVSGNVAPLPGRQLHVGGSDGNNDAELINTLISGNTLPAGEEDCYIEGSAAVNGLAVSNGATPGTCYADLPSSVASPDYLGPLEFNGTVQLDGPGGKYFGLQTIALLAGSEAIDAGNGSQPVDGRGYPRDANPDIGAYEFAADGDGDGVVDEFIAGPGTEPGTQGVLVLAPGDGNNDGTPDADQDDVATGRLSGEQEAYFTLESTGGAALSNVAVEAGTSVNISAYYESVAADTLTPFNGIASTPFGGISFQASGSGSFALILPDDAGVEQLIKLECRPLGDSPQWVVLDGTPEAFGADRIRFEFSISDDVNSDGRFDCLDGQGILDPVFPASGFSVSEVRPIPVLGGLLQWLLAGLLGATGLAGLRRSGSAHRRTR